MKTIFTRISLVLIVTLLSSHSAAGQTRGRRNSNNQPNFIVIFADDLGYGDLSSYGNREIRTPNLDRMAQNGIRMTNFYSSATVCTPSRAGLLTGRYQIRSGLTRVLFPKSQTGIGAEEITIAEALKARGYRTASIGKWHLGHLPEYLPTAHGFDYYYGIPYSNDMQPTPLVRNTETLEEPAQQETLTKRYTEEAIKFIREAKSQNRSFFLYLPHTMPHVPLYASPQFRGRSRGGLYGDTVEELDWSVGQILKTLADLNLDQETLVIFTSDNGPWLTKGKDAGTAGPLRDGKMSLYEGGVRVPFIARWTNRISRGVISDQPAIMLDLFPTLVNLAGGEVAKEKPVDGRDILPILIGKVKNQPRTLFFYKDEVLQAVRNGNWKLHLARKTNDGTLPVELYNLASDIGERENVAAAHPEVVKQLTELAQAFDGEARRTATPPKR